MTKKKDTGAIVLKNVRLSFNDLHQPQETKMLPNGDEIGGKYRAVVLMDKNDQQIKTLQKAIKACMVAKWGAKPPKIRSEKLPYFDGDESDREEQEGHYVITAREKPNYKPTIVGRKNEPLTEESGLPYSGCYVNIAVRPYAYDIAGVTKGISLSLKAVQFVRDGEPLGAVPISAEDVFDELEDEDEDDIGDLLGGDDDDDDTPF